MKLRYNSQVKNLDITHFKKKRIPNTQENMNTPFTIYCYKRSFLQTISKIFLQWKNLAKMSLKMMKPFNVIIVYFQ